MKKLKFVAAAALVAALSIFASCTKDNAGADNDKPLNPEEALMEYLQGDWGESPIGTPEESKYIFLACAHFGEKNYYGYKEADMSVFFIDYYLTLKSNDGKTAVFEGHYREPSKAALSFEYHVSRVGEDHILIKSFTNGEMDGSEEMKRISGFTSYEQGEAA